MRKIAWWMLVVFAFTIPWEYSLDLGASLGNIARVTGLLLALAAIPAVLQTGRLRTLGSMQWLVLALFLWFCCTCFWTIELASTVEKLRGFLQETMAVWLVWEFAESPQDLRSLLQAFIAGSWVLAALTLADFRSAEAMAAGQFRFVAEGQDPNDVARFLDLAFPLAALLANGERRWPARLLATGYFPLGIVAVILTASRGGFVGAVVALLGSGLLLSKSHAKGVFAAALFMPVLAAALWFTVPHETIERLATIPAQLQGGDLNQRMNLWQAGWEAFARSPLLGTGVGSFAAAAGTNPMDTAHNTALSVMVESGLVGLFLASGVAALALWATLMTGGPLRVGLATALLVWAIASLVSTVEENRATWLLLGLAALAGRLAIEDPEALADCFAAPAPHVEIVRWAGVSHSSAN